MRWVCSPARLLGTWLIANLFALRSASPGALRVADDPVGPYNDRWLAKITKRAIEGRACLGRRRPAPEVEARSSRARFAAAYCFGQTSIVNRDTRSI